MLRKFELIDDNIEPQKEHAILTYDEENDIYSIYVPKTVKSEDLPAIPALLVMKGIREIEDKWARRFVQERVVPPNRQNIGEIMRQVGMTYYSEFPLLLYTSGRCCMDDFYIREITEK